MTKKIPDTGDLRDEGVASIAALARASDEANAHPGGGRPYVVVPPGHTVQELSEAPKFADRLKGSVQLHDQASFVVYVNRMKAIAESAGMRPVIYLDASSPQPSMVAVLNEISDRTAIGFRDWRAVYKPEHSRQWQAWASKNGTAQSQTEFATFIEDNISDIAEPSGASLLEMAIAFEMTRDQSFKSSVRLQDGSVAMTFIDQDSNKVNEGRLPREIALSIPIFKNAAPSMIRARLKYRVKDQKLVIWHEMLHAAQLREFALAQIADDVRALTDLPVLFGNAS